MLHCFLPPLPAALSGDLTGENYTSSPATIRSIMFRYELTDGNTETFFEMSTKSEVM